MEECQACKQNQEPELELNTPTVLEITSPSETVTFHTVELEGTETDTPMVNGLYRNILVVFKGNDHKWLYNSDGIPTFLTEKVNNGTLTLTVDGEVKGTFSANQEENVEIDLIDKILPLYHETGQNTDGPIDQKVVTDALETKVDKVSGKGLSTNDYTDADKTKLSGIEDGAEVNVNADWNATSGDAEILNKPTIPSKTSDITNDSDYQNSTQVETAITTATTPINTAIDKTVMTDFTVDANPSTATITLDKAKQNILSGATSSSTTALPVASAEQAGVMNSATYNAITENTTNINAILNGTVAVSDLPESPTQDELTAAWKTATGATELINGAKIYDQTNSKIWTYYANRTQWLSTGAGGSVTVNQWTNDAAGIVKGSTVDGQIFAESDGTGSVNGWDGLLDSVNGKEPEIVAGTTAQYWRGDKTWQTLDKTAVGLSNVDNTSDATKKANFTGSIASSNTGFVTGGDTYAALSNKADSSDIKDGKLTIQMNGTDLGSFTANSPTDETVNVTTITAIDTTTTGVKQLVDEDGNSFSAEILDSQVTSAKIADGAVTKAKLGSDISHETWTFTLSDGTLVTKDVMLYS